MYSLNYDRWAYPVGAIDQVMRVVGRSRGTLSIEALPYMPYTRSRARSVLRSVKL